MKFSLFHDVFSAKTLIHSFLTFLRQGMYIKSTYDGLHVITGTTEHVRFFVFFLSKRKHRFALLSLTIQSHTVIVALPLALCQRAETKGKKKQFVDWNQEASIAHLRGRAGERSLARSLARRLVCSPGKRVHIRSSLRTRHIPPPPPPPPPAHRDSLLLTKTRAPSPLVSSRLRF